MADPPGRRRRLRGARARRRTEELALAHLAQARLARALPAVAAARGPGTTAAPVGDADQRGDVVASDGSAEADGPPRLTRRAVVGVALVCLVGVVAAGLHLVRARPAEVELPAPARSLPPSSRPTATVVVDVAGAVRRPGVYTLPVGARVGEALARAGGAVAGADTSALNLARVVADGEQVLVSKLGAAAGSGTAGPGSAGSSGPLVDLNSATLDQLETLPGVGPVLGQRILDWRQAHGRFGSVDELREVSGVGERKFAELKPLVRV